MYMYVRVALEICWGDKQEFVSAMQKIERDNLGQKPIPDDLLLDILVCLPAKSLMRFKIVCKSWHALIRDPRFAESHHAVSRTRRPDSSHVLLYVTTENAPALRRWMSIFPVQPRWGIFPVKLDDGILSNHLPVHMFDGASAYDENKWFHRAKFISATNIVNGLICLWVEKEYQFELLNLTTKEKVPLPRSELWLHSRNPCNPAHYLGFDPIKKQYKVLIRFGEGEYFIITFSGDKRMSWRKVDGLPQLGIYRRRENTCVDGAIYWHTYSHVCELPNCEGWEEKNVQYFEVGQEKFNVLPVHDHVGNEPVDSVFQTEVGGKFTLAFLNRSHSHGTTDQITLWRLINRRDQDWVRSRIELPSWLLVGRRYLSFSGSTNTGDMLVKISNLYACDTLIFCDLEEDKKHATLKLMSTDKFSDWIPTPMPTYAAFRHHVENILPLNLLNDMRKG
ncbi:OLC1v1006597C1 [Oldenlandia corymbosa var. corymbosa]|uniref:OLC1v1006597C1 n=1 Tax=Oldenlandia corymbosa var. corymbosa TaxID=529605 RepID=A0AAV1DK34_OLDCO|nr:OLC1v1006597C1 [Oldenlandia corymbosa var. corymbosa]